MIQGHRLQSILPRSTSKIPVSQNHRSFRWEPGEDIHHRANSNACCDGFGPGALAFTCFSMKQMGRQEQVILTVWRHTNIVFQCTLWRVLCCQNFDSGRPKTRGGKHCNQWGNAEMTRLNSWILPHPWGTWGDSQTMEWCHEQIRRLEHRSFKI